jgi:hypothetical protein
MDPPRSMPDRLRRVEGWPLLLLNARRGAPWLPTSALLAPALAARAGRAAVAVHRRAWHATAVLDAAAIEYALRAGSGSGSACAPAVAEAAAAECAAAAAVAPAKAGVADATVAAACALRLHAHMVCAVCCAVLCCMAVCCLPRRSGETLAAAARLGSSAHGSRRQRRDKASGELNEALSYTCAAPPLTPASLCRSCLRCRGGRVCGCGCAVALAPKKNSSDAAREDNQRACTGYPRAYHNPAMGRTHFPCALLRSASALRNSERGACCAACLVTHEPQTTLYCGVAWVHRRMPSLSTFCATEHPMQSSLEPSGMEWLFLLFAVHRASAHVFA